MNRIDSIITNGKESIKCSNCGSEKKFVLVKATESPSPAAELCFANFQTENQTNEKKTNLAHLFEAQKRFGE
jgi:DTW domain-containing protein YfiP